MQVEKMSDLSVEANPNIRALVYGGAGTKKTTLIGSFPKPIWIANFDQKLERLYGIEGIDSTTYSPKGPEDSSKVFYQFEKDWKAVKKDGKYKTMALDGITMWDIIVVRHFIMLSGKAPDDRATLPVYMAQADYYSYFFKYGINDILDKNVIVTAHELYHEDSDSKVVQLCPLITGSKILAKLPGMFKETWHMTKEGGDHGEVTLWYEEHKRAIANSLILHGSGFIKNPTYESIMKEVVKGN